MSDSPATYGGHPTIETVEANEARAAANGPTPLDINSPEQEDRKMPDAAYVAQPECARNSQNENHWRSLGDVAASLVEAAARKIGGAA